jgi:hypothetical protein
MVTTTPVISTGPMENNTFDDSSIISPPMAS